MSKSELRIMFGPKQCSEFEELCTGTAEEVMFLLCFRNEGSGAKQCSGFEGKISKSELCTGTAAELLHYCVLKPNHDIYCVC